MLNICSWNPKTYILNQKPNLDFINNYHKEQKTQIDTFFETYYFFLLYIV